MTNVSLGVNIPIESNTAKKNERKGAAAALLAGAAAQIAPVPVSMLALNKMSKLSLGLSQDELNLVNKAADTVVDGLTDLGKKGVKIENFKNKPLNLTNMPEWLLNMTNAVYATANGKNAVFVSKDMSALNIGKNTIIVNREKLSLAQFHELGHAFNFNSSKFWKAMQGLRGPSMLAASLFALYPAITKEEKAAEGEELTKGQKFRNGLRKASPALAFASMVPMLMEEGMASIRGCRWAKQLLDPVLSGKVLKTNIGGYASYIGAAIGIAAASFAALKVKDHFDSKQS